MRAPLDPLTNMGELVHLDLVPVVIFALLVIIHLGDQPLVQHALLDIIQQQEQHLVRNALLEVTVVRLQAYRYVLLERIRIQQQPLVPRVLLATMGLLQGLQ